MALSRIEREIINEMALKIREYYYNTTSPINDIDKIVQKMQGKVVNDSSRNIFSDGCIKKTDDNSFVIEVSSSQSQERRNFTIAHELGHLFLHMGYKTNDDLWESQANITYHRTGISHEEYQANEFAAAFLMPKELYLEAAKKHTNGRMVDIDKVAAYFHVSIDAAANRGKWLGYLEW